MEQKPSSSPVSASSASSEKKGKSASPKAANLVKKSKAAATSPVAEGPKLKSKPAPKPPAPGAWRKWAMGAGLLAVIIGLGWGMASMLMGSKPEGENKPAAKKKDKKGKGKQQAKPAQEPAPEIAKKPEKPPEKPAKKPEEKAPPKYVPIVPPKSKDILPLTLARLATEYAADPAETSRKYHATFLEVSGRFQKLDQRATGGRPARTHVLFQAEGRPLLCDLEATTTDYSRWNQLKPGEPITVRGVYNNKEFCLHQCQLLPYQPPAVTRFRGKKLELVGAVSKVGEYQGFPALWLERASTNSTLDVVCLFPKPERENLKKIEVGTSVTVQGTCNGRNDNLIRMDNCQLVETTAPEPPIERIEAVAFLREYEEDQLLFVPPLMDEQAALSVTLDQLGTELAADPKSLDKKYRHRILNVSGLVAERQQRSSTVILESNKTDQMVKVHCVFAPRNFLLLPSGATLRIRGICTGMLNATTLRLDDCEPVDAVVKNENKNAPKVTADFFPHKPGEHLTYDLARLTPKGGREVIRQAHLQLPAGSAEEDGRIETLTYFMGKLSNPLFEEKPGDPWIHRRGTKKWQTTPQPGPVYHRRVKKGAFVEIGTDWPSSDGKGMTILWEPVLKLGATQGTTWKWNDGELDHLYKVLDIQEKGGRATLEIQETVRSPRKYLPLVEVRHVYVRGIGEIERRQWQYLTTRAREGVLHQPDQELKGREWQSISTPHKKILFEKKLVDESEAPPVLKTKPGQGRKPDPEPTKKP